MIFVGQFSFLIVLALLGMFYVVFGEWGVVAISVAVMLLGGKR